jgi:DNA adenine methylase
MSENIFKYPGAKTQLADWIINRFPQHRTYVEVFGGSAAVLANKPHSKVEVYNDRDGDLVHFFETLRDSGEELREWLAQTPHSRQLHARYADEFYDGVRPDDDVERAGRFFYLRETQFAQKYTQKSGYSYEKKRNGARAMQNKVDRLSQWQERFRHVQIEQLDYAELIERYDSPQTFFYCDPPYMDEGDALYSHDGFNHGRFSESLIETNADWMVSYTRVPEPLHDAAVTIAEQEREVSMRKGQGDWEKTNTERLVMNYDPETVEGFTEDGQPSLTDWTD